MSEDALAGLALFEEAAVEPLGDEGPVDGREGVAAGVTFRGSAAEDGGAMADLHGVQCSSERLVILGSTAVMGS